jgi:hypothetical protein
MILQEGLRMFKRARQVRKGGFREYQGSATEICKQIIHDCYDEKNKYFMTSIGHFCEYYTRDFAFCCEALVELGYKKEVRSTIEYALKRFVAIGRVTTAISPDGQPFDYFMPSGPESTALLLYTITHTGNHDLAVEYKRFLQQQVDRVQAMMHGALPHPKKYFSTIRDHAKRPASCYDAVMLAVIAREAAVLKLKFPHSFEQVRNEIIATYWNGTYFFQDIRKQDLVEGDANVFPFWTGVITDRSLLEQAMTAMQAAGLDSPFPLRYVATLDKKREKTSLHFANYFVPDYETDSIWMHLGLAYLRILHDPKVRERHLATYTAQIETHKTFLEIYDTAGTPLRRQLYVTDEGMLWCANYLALIEKFKKNSVITQK